MKKLNNKGFAISTVIYGLSIMGIMLVAILMASMASTRSNSRQLAKTVEEELNRFSKTETFFAPKTTGATPVSQEYVVPTSGWYKIELWGSSGSKSGSNGAYTTGVIKLKEGDILYFYVGKKNSGRETDVRVIAGEYNSEYSASSRIMVAAGGGNTVVNGRYPAPGGTLVGYSVNMDANGGMIKSNANGNYKIMTPGQPIKEGLNNVVLSLIGNTEKYQNVVLNKNPAAGTGQGLKQPDVNDAYPPRATKSYSGDGYYQNSTGETGGISFIAGYAGSRAIDKGIVSANPIVNIYEQSYITDGDNAGSIQYGTNPKAKYYFLDGMMLPNVDAYNGDGYAKIERMALIKDTSNFDNERLTPKTDKLNNVKGIKSCIKGTPPVLTTDTWNHLMPEIIGVRDGIDKFSGVAVSNSGGTIDSGKCFTKTISGPVDLDEIAIIYNYYGYDFYNHKIYLIRGDGTEELVSSSSELRTETSVPTGYRISAYQYNNTQALPDKGNYYIMPVLSENKFMTANEKSHPTQGDMTSDAIGIEAPNGSRRQRWAIEAIKDANGNNTGEYKIYELARYYALTILDDENMVGNKIGADDVFNSYSKDETQYWRITPVGDGTYRIATIIPSFDNARASGYIIAQTNPYYDNHNKIVIAPLTASETARFKIISVDYSN